MEIERRRKGEKVVAVTVEDVVQDGEGAEVEEGITIEIVGMEGMEVKGMTITGKSGMERSTWVGMRRAMEVGMWKKRSNVTVESFLWQRGLDGL